MPRRFRIQHEVSRDNLGWLQRALGTRLAATHHLIIDWTTGLCIISKHEGLITLLASTRDHIESTCVKAICINRHFNRAVTTRTGSLLTIVTRPPSKPDTAPFSLTNAPSKFQLTMNKVFHELLDKCVTVYLDNILIL
ncbi:unnamed protein product [Closterium sp. NIES-54]